METTTFAILFLIARLILGAVFLMSAVPKLAAPRQFANDVQQYGMLPRPLAAGLELKKVALSLEPS